MANPVTVTARYVPGSHGELPITVGQLLDLGLNASASQAVVPYRDSNGNWGTTANALLYRISRVIPGTIAAGTDLVPWMVALVGPITFVSGIATIQTTDATGTLIFVIKLSTDGGTTFNTVALTSGDRINPTTKLGSTMIFTNPLVMNSGDMLSLDMTGNTTTAANFSLELLFRVNLN